MQLLLAERYGQEPQRVAAMILLGNALAIVIVPVALAIACPVREGVAPAARTSGSQWPHVIDTQHPRPAFG